MWRERMRGRRRVEREDKCRRGFRGAWVKRIKMMA
jgi:hypothetical protein